MAHAGQTYFLGKWPDDVLRGRGRKEIAVVFPEGQFPYLGRNQAEIRFQNDRNSKGIRQDTLFVANDGRSNSIAVVTGGGAKRTVTRLDPGKSMTFADLNNLDIFMPGNDTRAIRMTARGFSGDTRSFDVRASKEDLTALDQALEGIPVPH